MVEPTAHECETYLFWCTSLREYLVDQPSHVVSGAAAATSANDVLGRSITKNNDNKSGFDIGDHVYLWCNVAGFTKVYQHHGIVIGVRRRRPQEDKVDQEQEERHDNLADNNSSDWILHVADFSLMDESESPPASLEQFGQLCASTSTASTGSGDGTCGGFKVYDSPAHKWIKVQYLNDAEAKRGDVHVSQEKSSCNADYEASIYHSPPQVVRARVEFLLQRPELLPSYLLHESNCECVAVWAKTGRYQVSPRICGILMEGMQKV